MTGVLQAGTGARVITPRVGANLIGYFNRAPGSTGVHDELLARALVLDDGKITLALCSVDTLWLWSGIIKAIRGAVAARCAIPPENVLIACTHTHSGPAPHETDGWDRPLAEIIAEAVVEAYEGRQPARLGFGFGQLTGYNINRRWLNRPADPSVGVLRVDTADGAPLAVVSNYACHAVVMGYDSNLISGDWPGYSSRLLEAELGCMALFTQGGAGDLNPLTENVRERLAAGHPVAAIGDVSSYYGYSGEKANAWNIGDRGGGTFEEAEIIAKAVNTEILRVWRGVETAAEVSLWTETLIVNAAVGPDEPPAEGLTPDHYAILPEIQPGLIPMEIMLAGISNAVLMTQPGEVFSETAVAFRMMAQQMGFAYPWLVSYANGSYAYLPPANAFGEGGYEVSWARRYGLSQHLQEWITAAARAELEKRI